MELELSINGLSLKIKEQTITAIMTDKIEESMITSDDNKKISIVKDWLNPIYYNKKCNDLMHLEIKNNNLILKDEIKKITDALKIVGLKSSTLNKNFSELSFSEKKLFMLALNLLHNSMAIIIKNLFLGLDLKNEKKISMLFRKMKEEYNKTIIIISNDSDIIYKYADYLIIIKEKQKIAEGLPIEIYQKTTFLKRNKISIPDIVKVTYLAKKTKNIKLEYHKDVRDIIKDIYKHV